MSLFSTSRLIAKCWLLIVASLLCVMPAIADTAAPPVEQTPIQIKYTPLVIEGKTLTQMMIKVRLNETTAATFFVDTGSVTSVISKALVKKLGLTPEPAIDDDGKPVYLFKKGQTRMVRLTYLTLDGEPGQALTFIDLPLAVDDEGILKFGSDAPLDGIIGANLFRRFAALINTQDHTLLVLHPGNLSPDQLKEVGMTGAYTVPIAQKNEVTAWYATVQFNNGHSAAKEQLKLDTGSNSTVISAQTAKQLHLTATSKEKNVTFDGEFILDGATADALHLGGLTVPNFPVQYQANPKVFSTLILGLDAFYGNRVLIDIPAGKMYLQPLPLPVHKITIGPVAAPPPTPAP